MRRNSRGLSFQDRLGAVRSHLYSWNFIHREAATERSWTDFTWGFRPALGGDA